MKKVILLLLVIFLYMGQIWASDGPQNDFVERAVAEAREVKKETKIPISATVAMAIYESSYGKSQLAKKYHNYFGLKAYNWNGPVAKKIKTKDYGKWTKANFRAYSSMREGFFGFAEFLKQDHYKKAFDTVSGVDFVKELLKAGYCPDRVYLRDIKIIIKRHNLEIYDSQQVKIEKRLRKMYNS